MTTPDGNAVYLVQMSGPLVYPSPMRLVPKDEKDNTDWTNRIDSAYVEESSLVHQYMFDWLAQIHKGWSIPVPKRKWDRVAAEGFLLLCRALKNAGCTGFKHISDKL